MPAVVLAMGAGSDDPLAERRAAVEAMPPRQQQELLRRYQEFKAMTPERQERLRTLHRRIEEAPNSDELRATVERYTEWMETLDPDERSRLLALPADARIKEIHRLRTRPRGMHFRFAKGRDAERMERFKQWGQQQREVLGAQINRQDLQAMVEWRAQYAAEHAAEIEKDLDQSVRRGLDKIKDPKHRREVLLVVWARQQANKDEEKGDKSLPISDEELATLRSKLSDGTRERLEQLDPDKQREIVSRWVLMAAWQMYAFRLRGPRPDDVTDEQLAEFLQNGLDPQQRDHLLGLSPDEMNEQLRVLYWLSKVGPGPAGPPARREGFRFGPSGTGPPRGTGPTPGPPRNVGPDNGPPHHGPFSPQRQGQPREPDRAPQ